MRRHRPTSPLAFLLLLWALLSAGPACADGTAFDLLGPSLEVTVTRNATVLPIAEVPNLSEGDELRVRADLSGTQATHYLMVVAFLRGATNPPPKDWFHGCETWKHPCADAGLSISVPRGAQQVVVLLAPATGGDLRTIVSAVSGRPGAFVRASQALNQAALDRSRLDAYLAAVTQLDRTDRDRLKEATPLLARSLAVKADEHCLNRLPELQAPCLMQGQDALILNDGHSASLVETLTSGPSADLALVAASAPTLGSGYFGPYVASILDLGRIFNAFRSAQYQYIPGLAIAKAERLQITLNSPPSFHNPMSVLVSALPAVAPTQLPPLHAIEPTQGYCAARKPVVLPAEGAPLVFSTQFAHDLQLRIADGSQSIELPAHADAEAGGVLVDAAALTQSSLDSVVAATLHGRWGFDTYNGPVYKLILRSGEWSFADADDASIVIGHDDVVHLRGNGAACLRGFSAHDASGAALRTQWKQTADNEIEVTLALQGATSGPLVLQPLEVDGAMPPPLTLHAFADVVRIDSLLMDPPSGVAVLRGNRLDQVRALRVEHLELQPQVLLRVRGADELTMAAVTHPAREDAAQFEHARARVQLANGRMLAAPVQVAGPSPVVTLLSRTAEHVAHGPSGALTLAGADEVAPDETLRFALRVEAPVELTAESVLDIASADHRVLAQVPVGPDLVLTSAQVAVATLQPQRLLGPLGFGRLQFRLTSGGLPSAWQDLATVVRVPEIDSLECATSASSECTLHGRGLFLIARVKSSRESTRALEVPEGYTDGALSVPHPAGAALGLVLRDDQSTVQSLRVAGAMPGVPATSHTAKNSPAKGTHVPASAARVTTEASAEPAQGAPAGAQPNP